MIRLFFAAVFSSFLFLSMASASSVRGEWGSSGNGEFFRDQHNPWFVKNVDQVTYCLAIDSAGFSARPEKIETLTRAAIDYWLQEFKEQGEVLGIGTQKFILSSANGRCSGNEDLTFQFGFGALSADQLLQFQKADEDPQNYVGIAMRTGYDREQLRGKGFIFIGSDKGSHPYNHGGITKNLWSHDGLLFRILQHELGHVFGVAHTDDGFMAADFPENMVRDYRPFRTVQMTPFFLPPRSYEKCRLGGGMFFPCFKVDSRDSWGSFQITQWGPSMSSRKIERSILTEKRAPKLSFPVKIFLPKEQKVFEAPPGERTLRGPSRQEFKMSSTVVDEQGKKSFLLLELKPESIEVFGVTEEGIKPWF